MSIARNLAVSKEFLFLSVLRKGCVISLSLIVPLPQNGIFGFNAIATSRGTVKTAYSLYSGTDMVGNS